ncbi:hypothetical protein J4050_06875 [Winogradskyella sp. DF17]|jgi:hypothetical protein|uniref:ATP synthase F0 sector subunit C n=1 Tax=Winogradskyella pelagia TaxID=2819984 RepID=A0ABS3T144_9FLAO|nr:hypothetical protein [Winogradskyella sp. DF17]MBO3116463.1 hypothetical protein [Winogradskyella sp. DF17]
MKYKLRPNFFFIVVALIVGSALFRQIDFQNLTIEKPALAIIYGVTFLASILLMLKKPKK